jgi:ubiquinone/menaquinone biosynthesis C-methylase UbiE
MAVQLDEFKSRQRAMWDAGDYAALTDRIADVGETVVARAAIEPGVTVLDVACGAGNAAIQAAKAGARTTGLDLAPGLLAQGRAKAGRAGVEADWVEGDAESLPFADGSFDRVLSTFGHMFAPRHQLVADEMMRVCRPGGRIVTATWLPEGLVGRMFAATAAFMPPPPEYASPPMLWGTEEHVREMFGSNATAFEFERHVNWIEHDSVESWAEHFTTRFGPLVTARAVLGERFQELRDSLVDIWSDANQADDGSLRFPQEYLVSIVRV